MPKKKEKGKEVAAAPKRPPPKKRSTTPKDPLPPPPPTIPPWTPSKIARSKRATSIAADKSEDLNVAAASSTSEYHNRYADDSDIDYDDILGGIVDDSEDEFNTSFPKDKTRSKLRVPGGTGCPDISMMSEEEGKKVMKQWQVQRKAFTDKLISSFAPTIAAVILSRPAVEEVGRYRTRHCGCSTSS